MPVVIPAWVAENRLREQMIDRELGKGHALSKAVASIDPRLSIVLISDRAPRHWNMIPGRWAVRRRNTPPAADSYLPIVGPDDCYLEPHSGIYDLLQKADLQRKDIFEAFSRAYDRQTVEQERREALEHEQRVDMMAESIRAGQRVAGNGGMTRRAWGRG